MESHMPHEGSTTAVAVDRDKHSASAVRWAIDNLLVTNTTLNLLHVKTRNLHNQNGGASEVNNESFEDLFMQFRACGARKGIVTQPVVLQGTDVHGTLIEYISSHHISNIVLGASSRSPITRMFWTHDVPTMINKAAPDFCSVYVISRGKTQSVRPAAQPAASSTPPTLPSPRGSPRTPAKFSSETMKTGRTLSNGSMDHHQENSSSLSKKPSANASWWSSRNSSSLEVSSRGSVLHSSSWKSRDNDLTEPDEISHGSTGIANGQMLGKSMGETADHEGNSSPSINELEKLKLEVKQTMNMYNTACKEAVSLKHHADELQEMNKLDDVHGLEQARTAEEAALVLLEVEKAKCRAAVEAAEKAQELAKRETQRRKQAELRANREAKEKSRALTILSNNDVRYRKYTIEEIEAATNKFSRSFKIGEGGYGPVFKGKLDHTRVAVKVLRPDAAQGRKQFQQEVEVLSFMRHPNMVLLMGACPEYGILVYEYMNNGSLEDRLFRKGNTPPIPWGIRFKIAVDIATGLLFLHQAKPEPLVHRDLKPANILLDRNYTCKISDVGLARLVPPSVADSVTQYHMTSAAGTFCYIDPEYQQTGRLGTKSDIYSLGVMLLQIITARPPMGLTHQVEKAIERGTFADFLDPSVPDWPIEETIGYANMALKCAELRKKDRPDLAKDILPQLNRLKKLGTEHVLWHKKSSRRSSPYPSFG
ncbi:U-box domain-containing protein 52 [Sesamum angolense]|uniref:RING-type E3 ubiquitin transferase n=1 Tax=Sesamum angolense TaxID=2727404 RepID=A0AAE1WXS0_9LAMI|nr:U-box domain-containing protein 52 [Sesamum angolense]